MAYYQLVAEYAPRTCPCHGKAMKHTKAGDAVCVETGLVCRERMRCSAYGPVARAAHDALEPPPGAGSMVVDDTAGQRRLAWSHAKTSSRGEVRLRELYVHVDTFCRRLRVRAFASAAKRLLVLWEKRRDAGSELRLKKEAAVAAVVLASRLKKRTPEVPVKLAATILDIGETAITNYVKAMVVTLSSFGVNCRGRGERGTSSCFRWAGFLAQFGDDFFAADPDALPLLKTLALLVRPYEKQIPSSPDAVAGMLLSLTSYLLRGRDLNDAFERISTFATCRATCKAVLAIAAFVDALRREVPPACAERCVTLLRTGYVPAPE